MIAELLEIHTKNANYDENQANFQEEEFKDELANYFRDLGVDWGLHSRSKGSKLMYPHIMLLWGKAN